ncbi:MAG TPA: bifunctional precorrin-2 dehydrogenase/sirohydrochlorin ferrochelatase [Acidimicrobiales bacterium]|nr:bifunctional precorrin-2 dehydrogenase/sirohydrochlorin ferrochelatase [Acidimicrobiales bacterium]
MAAPSYPVNLLVAGRSCLVVGGGTVALEKVDGLLEAKAVVTVVAPEIVPELAERPVTIEQRPYHEGEAANHRLVIVATDDPQVNARVAADAEAAGVWVNAADDVDNCTFTLPARVRRGDLLLTVSTGGRSPGLASWTRKRLEEEFGPEWGVLLQLLAEARDELRAQGRSTLGVDWHAALDSGMLELVREGQLAEAKERLQACLSSSSD